MVDKKQVITSFSNAHNIAEDEVKKLLRSLQGNVRKGKEPSQQSMRVRNALRRFAARHKGSTAISADLANALKTDITTLNNNLRVLEKEGVVQSAGQLTATGRKGRQPVLWKFN